jgi:hypothetical protein
MAMKPNYKFDKRQRDLAKKKQQDEKRQKKLSKNGAKDPAVAEPAPSTGDAEGARTE